MFARKVKSADFTVSFQRFIDLHRDCASRAKHLKFVLDALCSQDKRQFMEDYSFETFHLVDELLLQADLTQSVLEAESALWTLEQLLYLTPRLVGSGWQKHAIEYVLKKALFPHNLLAVRKIALRLFIIWYQSLAMYCNNNSHLDIVFQCLLPHFPLRNSLSSESILHNYCQSTANTVGPGPIRNSPLVINPNNTATSAKEKAQLLQLYLDKFLEYCTRETIRIEWDDENIRLECAKFILDRVIVLYIYEIFPDIETNGVDIYGGWEGSEGQIDIRDIADPIIIARYWLIRWMATVALSTNSDLTMTGQLLYRKALFSSRKATNTLLTLLKEAVMLPLPCSNVIHKVFSLISAWLLQRNLPPFIEQEGIAIESLSLLLIHFLTSFFHSPYLPIAGERLSSAISLTQSLLQTTRDLSSPSTHLQNPLSTRVWCELIKSLADGIRTVTSRSDAYGRATSGVLAQNLLGVIIFVRAISVEIEERVWDDVLAVFQSGCWMQMIEQWSRVVDSVTRALILNLFEIDVAPPVHSASHQIVKRIKSNEMGSTQDDGNTEFSEETRFQNDSSVEDENAQFISVLQSTGDALVWLRVWMRIVNLVSPLHAAHSYLAVQTISKTINTLLQLSGTDALIHWISTRLLLLPPSDQAHCLPAYCAVLSTVNPPPLVEAHILVALARAIVSERFIIVLEYMPFMSKDYLTVLARPALSSLTQLIKQSNFSPRSVQVAALLSPDHAVGETLLLNLLELNSSEVPLQSYALALHALALLIIERADTKLLTEVINRVCTLKTSSNLLYMFCADLNQLKRLGLRDKLATILEQALDFVKEDCLASEILWQSVSASLMDCQLKRSLLERVLNDKRLCLEGFLLTFYRQFPLPSFALAHCNSVENITGNPQQDTLVAGRVFFDQGRAILSVDMDNGLRMTSRTPVGKHCWCFTQEHTVKHQKNCVNNWLRKLALRPKKTTLEMTRTKEIIEDPFEKLPKLPRILQADPIECNEMYFFIQQNRRLTTNVATLARSKPVGCSQVLAKEKYLLWRTLAADLRLFSGIRQFPSSFNRDVRHLDHTYSREMHKVAVIYVAKGQEDKISVLSNSCGSAAFNEFILRLGWQVQIGHQHYGYSGGLPSGVTAPYYASADTEIIFHVSTMLNGDITQKLKHLGNDEVHVVWSENDRPYHRDIIATQFCDVLIVLYRMSPFLFRIRIETQRPLEFGPLFDGAHIHICMLPHLVRDTVINASRAYRLSQRDCARPLQHREKNMNILPKKKWHVRTKENVARIRRDQKKAKEQEKAITERAQLAEQEYKVNLLRQNAERIHTTHGLGKSGTDDNDEQFTSSRHVNLFIDLETEYQKNLGVKNREYELEKKKEQEEYEKKIGILQYLGQGSSEFMKEKPWYEKIPTKKESEFRELENRSSVTRMKLTENTDIKKKEHKKKYKDKKSHHKKGGKKSRHHDFSLLEISDLKDVSKKQKLEKLRQERLDREAKERKRLINLLTFSENKKERKESDLAKYNSQFNPTLARQNQIR